MLNPNETFEIYENRGHSPLSLERINPVSNSNESLRQQEPEQRKFAIFRVIERQKGKVPIGWIIAISISIPVFIILIMFVAVWLQEMGLI